MLQQILAPELQVLQVGSKIKEGYRFQFAAAYERLYGLNRSFDIDTHCYTLIKILLQADSRHVAEASGQLPARPSISFPQ